MRKDIVVVHLHKFMAYRTGDGICFTSRSCINVPTVNLLWQASKV